MVVGAGSNYIVVGAALAAKGDARNVVVSPFACKQAPTMAVYFGTDIKKGTRLPGSLFVLLSSTGNFPVKQSDHQVLAAFATTCYTNQTQQA